MKIIEQTIHKIQTVKKVIVARRHFDKYPPVFIIGAPRSGTTLLFQLLASWSGFSTAFEPWQIWKESIGNGDNDTYQGEVTQKGKLKLLLRYFEIIQDGKPFLLSKNPRDSLRLNYLNDIFPNARFIHIIRDGRDVTASIVKAWKTPNYRTDIEYDWIHCRIPGYREISTLPSHLKGAMIWVTCISFIEKALTPSIMKRYYSLRYEDLIENSDAELAKLISFLNINIQEEQFDELILKINNNVLLKNENPTRKFTLEGGAINSNSEDDAGSGTLSESIRIGKWKNDLRKDEVEECMPILESLLRRYGYIA